MKQLKKKKKYRATNAKYRTSEKLKLHRFQLDPRRSELNRIAHQNHRLITKFRDNEKIADRRRKRIVRYDYFVRKTLRRKSQRIVRKLRSNKIYTRKQLYRFHQIAIKTQIGQQQLRKKLIPEKIQYENEIFAFSARYRMQLVERPYQDRKLFVQKPKILVILLKKEVKPHDMFAYAVQSHFSAIL